MEPQHGGKALQIARKTEAKQFIFKHNRKRKIPVPPAILPPNTKQSSAILQINFEYGTRVSECSTGVLSAVPCAAVWCSVVQLLQFSSLFSNYSYNICFLAFLPFATHDIYKWQICRTVGGNQIKAAATAICITLKFPIFAIKKRKLIKKFNRC